MAIHLGRHRCGPERFDYDVSHFLRLHKTDMTSRSWIDNVDKFIQLVDAKFYIDTSASGYSHIYDGIDTIIHRAIQELIKLDSYFSHVKVRRTGSSMSGVKVGLPHESDYMMELPDNQLLKSGNVFDKNTLYPMIKKIVEDKANVLSEGLNQWIIHGVTEHERIGGICIVMQCNKSANDIASGEVGVTVDLVPVNVLDTTKEQLNEKAESLLSQNLIECAQKGHLYRLLDKNYCDTGLIENIIMAQLPKNMKQAFRVAKLLISKLYVTSYIPFGHIAHIGKKKRLRLYGFKPWISSYHVRILFLHLLLHIQGTDNERQFNGALFVICLFDMINAYIDKDQEYDVHLFHPLIEGRMYDCSYATPTRVPNRDFIRRLATENPVDIVDELSV